MFFMVRRQACRIQKNSDAVERSFYNAIKMRLLKGLTAGFFVVLMVGVSWGKGDVVRVALIGDSTVTAQSGWGMAFESRFNSKVKVFNFAVNGRSSKSWYDENRLPEVLATLPEYVLIQFGHNDLPGKGPRRETDPATSYRQYLELYVKEVKGIGATPVIISPVSHRRFTGKGKVKQTMTAWAEAARGVAEETGVPFIDLYRASREYYNMIGPEASMTFNPRKGDTTHCNLKGAEVIADLIVKEIRLAPMDLALYLK